jgi:hypothetical protein
LSFEANQGQADPQVQFLSRGSGSTLYLTGTEAVLQFQGPAAPGAAAEIPAPAVLHMQILGGNAAAQGVGLEPLPGKVNYFIGNDPQAWRTDVPTYAKVEFANVYDGIDLVYYGTEQAQLEYDFVVAPGADPRAIRLGFAGAERLDIDAGGDLLVQAGGQQVRLHSPVIYQDGNGSREEVSGGYLLNGGGQVAFQVGAYDPSKPLVIDPLLVYSTYLGGNGDDGGFGIAVDSTGSVYVAGYTSSTNFPTRNPFQPASGGPTDVFVSKLNAAGTALVYSTYLGGSGGETPYGHIAVDSAGNVYVTGTTASTNFPTRNALQPAYGGGPEDTFVTKLNPTGSALVYSTYLGGSGDESGYGCAVDGSGDLYVSGYTSSSNFPTTAGAFQRTYGGGIRNAYVAKLNPAGSALLFSTYLGGNRDDSVRDLTLDAAGNVYVTGWTSSTNFPTTASALQRTYGGGSYDGFVAKFNAAGTAVYSTYLGGSGEDSGRDIAVDSAGNAYVAGYTGSRNFPTRNALQPTYGGGPYDGFVTKLNAAGTALVYSTFLGGSGNDYLWGGIGLDSAGNAYVLGSTNSLDFPVKNAIQPTFGGGESDDFVAKLNAAGTALVYSTYLGGSGDEDMTVGAIAVDAAGFAYVTGTTESSDFPTKNPLQRSLGGGYDAFVVKIDPDLGPVLAPIADRSISAGSRATVTLSATDSDGDPITYGGSVESQAHQLKTTYSFFSTGNLWFNWGGKNEKWFQGKVSGPNQGWYFILPSGAVDSWDGSSTATGSLIATLETAYYTDPSRLYNATQGGSTSVSGNVLTVTPDAGFVGKLYVTATASDGKFSDSKPFTITVS